MKKIIYKLSLVVCLSVLSILPIKAQQEQECEQSHTPTEQISYVRKLLQEAEANYKDKGAQFIKSVFEKMIDALGIKANAQDAQGYTPLMCAVSNNSVELTEVLLRQPGVDVELKDEFGNTVLVYADKNKERQSKLATKDKKQQVQKSEEIVVLLKKKCDQDRKFRAHLEKLMHQQTPLKKDGA
jgi:ankyrin repeat protein